MKWKTGFYYIAQGAEVPIVLGFLDYKRKVGGIGPVFFPTGDIEADIREIRTYYADMRGRNSVKESVFINPASMEKAKELSSP